MGGSLWGQGALAAKQRSGGQGSRRPRVGECGLPLPVMGSVADTWPEMHSRRVTLLLCGRWTSEVGH